MNPYEYDGFDHEMYDYEHELHLTGHQINEIILCLLRECDELNGLAFDAGLADDKKHYKELANKHSSIVSALIDAVEETKSKILADALKEQEDKKKKSVL